MRGETVNRMPQIEIFPATPADAEGIEQLMYASVRATYPNENAENAEDRVSIDDVMDFYKDEQSFEGLEKLRKELAEPEAGVKDFVAKDKGEVVGYCRVSNRNPDNPDQNLLTRIHVLPSRKGERIGKLLWRQAQTALDQNKATVLWVVETNTPSVEVYEKHWGFAKTGKRKEKPMKSGAIRKEIEMLRKTENTEGQS